MKIAVTGRDGQVGWELCRTLAPLGELIRLGREPCNMAEPAQVEALMRELRPDIVVNAAAYTAVDRAESEAALAHAVNADAVGAMARVLASYGGRLVHYSTDYVFDGQGTQPYREDEPTAPLGAYGRSKLAGEAQIQASGVDHLILRTCWVYGTRGKNFLLTMLKLARERDSLRVVADQIGCPTSSRMIAETTAALIARGAPGPADGVVNLSCTGAASWHEFAQAIVSGGAQRGLCRAIPVLPIATHEYPTPARRPAYSVLDPSRLAERHGLRMPSWQQALDDVLDALASG